jgi:hypothetical protein
MAFHPSFFEVFVIMEQRRGFPLAMSQVEAVWQMPRLIEQREGRREMLYSKKENRKPDKGPLPQPRQAASEACWSIFRCFGSRYRVR